MSQSYAKCIIKHLNTHHVNGQSACTCTYVCTHTVLVECIAWIIQTQTQVPTIVKPNIHAYSYSLILILHKASFSIPTTSPLQCKGILSGILQYILLQSLCGRFLEESELEICGERGFLIKFTYRNSTFISSPFCFVEIFYTFSVDRSWGHGTFLFPIYIQSEVKKQTSK